MRYDEKDLPVNANGRMFLPCCGIELDSATKFPVRCGCHSEKKVSELEEKTIEEKKVFEEVIDALEEEGLTLDGVDESEGVGDTLEKVFKKFGITEDRIKWLTGLEECGCTRRKKWLNKVFSYRKKKDK